MTRFTRRALSLLTAVALIAGLFLGAPTSVRATPQTYYVGDPGWLYDPGSPCEDPDYWKNGDWTGGGEYDSDNDAIQDAGDNAVSGSVIYICAGNYVFAELVTVGAGKSLTFRGDGDQTVLDGNDITRIFNASPVNANDQGGVLTLRDMLIMDAEVTEWNAGAVVADGLSLDNVTITRTQGAYNGGALYAEGNVTIVDSTFTDNIASADGGALYAWNGERTVSISNSVFDGNTAGFSGGAIMGATVTVTDSTFTDNDATLNGGAISATTVAVTNSTFTHNIAVGSGGGAISATTVAVTNSTFAENSAVNNHGGAILATTAATVSSSTFTGNAAYGGGAIHASTATVTTSTFASNSATYSGGAISANTATVTTSTFASNSATYGGGAIYAVTTTVSTSTFTNNTAPEGGAIYAYTTATVSSSTFTGNVAYGGGAIIAYTTATVTSSTFTGNSAVFGGAIYAFTATIARSRFTRNAAGQHGGAVIIYAPTSDDLRQLRRNTFSRNIAASGGAITLGSCVAPSRSQGARVERANRFTGNRATEQRRTMNIELWTDECG